MKGALLIDKTIRIAMKMASVVAVVAVLLILIFVAKEALPILTSPEINSEAGLSKLFLEQPDFDGKDRVLHWEPVSEVPRYSVLPLFLGTLKVTFVALVIAVPLAILSAIFIVEFAPTLFAEIIKPCIELLAGIPSVIIGLLGLLIIGSFLQSIFGFDYRLNATVAGFCLSFAVIPIIFTLTEDSLTAVPPSYREAALALGANKNQVILKIVLPVATPGIFAGIILGLGRAIGETMIVLMCSGNTPLLSLDLANSVRTMSATIASEMPEVQVGSAHYHVLFFLGFMLFCLTFITNMLGQLFVNHMRRKLEG